MPQYWCNAFVQRRGIVLAVNNWIPNKLRSVIWILLLPLYCFHCFSPQPHPHGLPSFQNGGWWKPWQTASHESLKILEILIYLKLRKIHPPLVSCYMMKKSPSKKESVHLFFLALSVNYFLPASLHFPLKKAQYLSSESGLKVVVSFLHQHAIAEPQWRDEIMFTFGTYNIGHHVNQRWTRALNFTQ